jgi:hypothetical protein
MNNPYSLKNGPEAQRKAIQEAREDGTLDIQKLLDCSPMGQAMKNGFPYKHIRSDQVVIMKKYVWLNLLTGDFSSSWDFEKTNIGLTEEQHEYALLNLLPKIIDSKSEWKLIKYECPSDENFEFNALMKLR